MNIKDDFKMLNKSIIYFDSAATSFKPNSVIDSIVDYYTNYTANAHRGDYDISLKVDEKYEEVRDKIKNLINADDTKEIIRKYLEWRGEDNVESLWISGHGETARPIRPETIYDRIVTVRSAVTAAARAELDALAADLTA